MSNQAEGAGAPEQAIAAPAPISRMRLPDRRHREGIDFEHDGFNYTACVGFYESGKIGEIFLTTRKAGTGMDAHARDLALLFSLAVQHGCPAENIIAGLTRGPDGRPASALGRALELIAEWG